VETLEGVYETALSNTGLYEVIEDSEVTDSAIELA
jgi:hypothetical protein